MYSGLRARHAHFCTGFIVLGGRSVTCVVRLVLLPGNLCEIRPAIRRE